MSKPTYVYWLTGWLAGLAVFVVSPYVPGLGFTASPTLLQQTRHTLLEWEILRWIPPAGKMGFWPTV